VLLVGPRPDQIGGLATFMRLALQSRYLSERYELLHLDITRGARGAGLASTWAPVNLMYMVRQTAFLLRLEVSHRPDIIHLPLSPYVAFWKSALFILIAKAMGTRVVGHLHGGWFERYYDNSSRMEKALVSWVLGQVDVAVALSEHWRRFLQRIRPTVRIAIVPNALDPEFTRLLGTIPEDNQRRPDLLLFVGMVTAQKGILDLLAVTPALTARRPGLRIVIAGPVENPQEQEEIDEAVAHAGAPGTAILLGTVHGAAKARLFKAASLLVLPSYAENLPFVVLEAMGADLPVVATSVGGIPELIQDGVTGFLVEPGDREALADRILRLLGDQELRESMACAARKRVISRHSPETAERVLDGLYGSLVDST
jgi:glycosyltransferase involved in cell wall biosynthesis